MRDETLEELHTRHAKVAMAYAERVKKAIEDRMERAKEHLFVLRGQHALAVKAWHRAHPGENT